MSFIVRKENTVQRSSKIKINSLFVFNKKGDGYEGETFKLLNIFSMDDHRAIDQ